MGVIRDSRGNPVTPPNGALNGAAMILPYTSGTQAFLAISSKVMAPSMAILGVEGDDFEIIARDGPMVLLGWLTPGDVPTPGFVVWEGIFKADRKPSPAGLSSIAFKGSFRPATRADFDRFKFPLPAQDFPTLTLTTDSPDAPKQGSPPAP